MTRTAGRGHEVGEAAPRQAAAPAIRCQACGLKFSALGYRLHQWTEPATGEVVCVPELELWACFGMHAWPKSPGWYSLPPQWEAQARRRLVESLQGGTVSAWQLRLVPLGPGGESLLDLVRLLVRRNRTALDEAES